MGDRAVVLFEDGEAIEPFAIYYHWAGKDGVESDYAAALSEHKDRRDDVSYFSARMIGLSCARHPGSTGIGLLAAPTPEQYASPSLMAQYSHGDAGVAVVNPEKGSIRWIEGTGYGARE